MVGEKERPFVEKLKELAPRLGFTTHENQRYACGHYLPDLVWRKGGKTVGFEVEYGEVNGKKIAGDAFWLCRTFDVGFIQVANPKEFGRFAKLITDLNADFKRKVYVISADLEKVKTVLKSNGLVD